MSEHDDALPARYTLAEVAAFLDGPGTLDGVAFGEPHPTERGAYWWRKHLRAALAARGGQPVGEVITEWVQQGTWGNRERQTIRWLVPALPTGTRLFAAPPAPSQAEAMRGALATAERLQRSLDDGHFEEAVEEAAAVVCALRAALGEGGR